MVGGWGGGRLPQGREAGMCACDLVQAPLRRPRRAEAVGVLVMVRVLVTGANGFAGTAICRHLMERGWAVRGAVRRAEAVVPAGAHKVVVGPLDGATDWQAALDGVDAVVHCAARVHVRRETHAHPLAAFPRSHAVATPPPSHPA